MSIRNTIPAAVAALAAVLAMVGCKPATPAVDAPNAAEAPGAASTGSSAASKPAANQSAARARTSAVATATEGESPVDETVKERVRKSDEEWRKTLTPEQYEICRRGGTERAFTGGLWDNKKPGQYRCACCGSALFDSSTKFESGTGWPSFYSPTSNDRLIKKRDTAYGMERIEVQCARCEAHLGHVFDDGPRPTGLRYCINSAALKFEERTPDAASSQPGAATSQPTETAEK